MKFRREGNGIVLSGSLTESADVETFGKILAEAAEGADQILVDFSAVERANSCGVFAWANSLRKVGLPIVYVNAPVWLVEVFNAMKELLPRESWVRTLQARFYAPAVDTAHTLTLEVGRDVPILDDYSDFVLSLKGPTGEELEADFEPVFYFHFIARRSEVFRKALGTVA